MTYHSPYLLFELLAELLDRGREGVVLVELLLVLIGVGLGLIRQHDGSLLLVGGEAQVSEVDLDLVRRGLLDGAEVDLEVVVVCVGHGLSAPKDLE